MIFHRNFFRLRKQIGLFSEWIFFINFNAYKFQSKCQRLEGDGKVLKGFFCVTPLFGKRDEYSWALHPWLSSNLFLWIYTRSFFLSCVCVECFHTFFNKFLCSISFFLLKPEKKKHYYYDEQYNSLFCHCQPRIRREKSVRVTSAPAVLSSLTKHRIFSRFVVVNCMNRWGTWKIERAQINNFFVAVRLSWHVKNHKPLRFTAANVLLIKDLADGSLCSSQTMSVWNFTAHQLWWKMIFLSQLNGRAMMTFWAHIWGRGELKRIFIIISLLSNISDFFSCISVHWDSCLEINFQNVYMLKMIEWLIWHSNKGFKSLWILWLYRYWKFFFKNKIIFLNENEPFPSKSLISHMFDSDFWKLFIDNFACFKRNCLICK